MILFHPKGFQGRVFPQWNVLGSGGVSQDSIQLIHLLHLIWNSFQILDGNENAEKWHHTFRNLV